MSMFLVQREDLEIDGSRPVPRTGYGGFNINMTPSYDPANRALLDRGGVLAVPLVEGAAASMARPGMKRGCSKRKQNVFDDFIAAAEWLIESRHPRDRGDWQSRAAATAGCLDRISHAAASGSLRRRRLPRPRRRHAPLSPVHHRPLLDPASMAVPTMPSSSPYLYALLAVPQRGPLLCLPSDP